MDVFSRKTYILSIFILIASKMYSNFVVVMVLSFLLRLASVIDALTIYIATLLLFTKTSQVFLRLRYYCIAFWNPRLCHGTYHEYPLWLHCKVGILVLKPHVRKNKSQIAQNKPRLCT